MKYVEISVILSMLKNPVLSFLDARIDSNTKNYLKYLGYKTEAVNKVTRIYNKVIQ